MNKNESRISIVDIPRQVHQADQFDTTPYEKGLTSFITNTNTPITIALQGEWGSGKTSMMNSLNKELSDGAQSVYHSVWLNTWEYSLMKDTETTLIDIIAKLIEEVSKISEVDEARKKSLIKNVRKIAFSAAKVAASVNSYTDKAYTELEKNFLGSDSSMTVGDIRKELEKIINECIEKHNKKGFIFFIDDLDRIDPPVAVELLELLKNIFTLNHCVFVLAIDYDVVIKGLEPKFGAYSEKNEREFRSFFDKIIQVPFSMPVNNYKINTFVKDGLNSINYLDISKLSDEELKKYGKVANLSVGNNPRSLKRLFNSLSLIQCINNNKNFDDEDAENNKLNDPIELIVNFAVVAIQIGYPKVYNFLAEYPDFLKWSNKEAQAFNLPSLNDTQVEKLSAIEEFDEEWEQVLYRLCEADTFLKNNAIKVSRLLNFIYSEVKQTNENLEDLVESVISLSAVTNLSSTVNKELVEYNKSHFLKVIRNNVLPRLKQQLPELASTIEQQGKRIVKNFVFQIGEEKVTTSTWSQDGIVCFYMKFDVWFGECNQGQEEDWKNAGIYDEFNTLHADYIEAFKESDFEVKPLIGESGGLVLWNNNYHINFNTYYKLPTPEHFWTEEVYEKIMKHLIKIYEFHAKFKALAKKRLEK